MSNPQPTFGLWCAQCCELLSSKVLRFLLLLFFELVNPEQNFQQSNLHSASGAQCCEQLSSKVLRLLALAKTVELFIKEWIGYGCAKLNSK